MHLKRLLLLQVILVLLFSGCKKDFDFDKIKSGTWTPDLALPLVFDSMTFQSGLEAGGGEKYFYIDESGNVSILYYYNNDAFRIRPSELLQLPPYSIPYNHQITAGEAQAIAAADFIIPGQNFQISLNYEDVRVDKMLIKKGSIEVNSLNTFSNSGNITLTFPEATKNGVPYSVILEGLNQGPYLREIDLSGVMFDLTADPGKVNVILGGVIRKSGSVTAGDMINLNITMRFDTIGKFEGYLGQHSIPMGEEFVRINVFNNAYALGTLWFEDPAVTITVYNSIGVPARVTMQEIRSVNLNSNIFVDIANQLGSNRVFDIPSPLINATKPVEKTMEYNNANTNNSLNGFVNIKPDRVYYRILTELNPGFTGTNHFSDTSSFYSSLQVKFPLYGYFDNLTIQDTFDFNLYQQENVDQVNLRTAITNGLPLMARMQIYFTDEHFVKLDSLTGTDNIFIKEAPVDPATQLPYPGQYGEKDTLFLLDHARIQRLEDARKIIVKAVMNSSGGGDELVRIKANQILKLQFSALIKLRKELSE